MVVNSFRFYLGFQGPPGIIIIGSYDPAAYRMPVRNPQDPAAILLLYHMAHTSSYPPYPSYWFRGSEYSIQDSPFVSWCAKIGAGCYGACALVLVVKMTFLFRLVSCRACRLGELRPY